MSSPTIRDDGAITADELTFLALEARAGDRFALGAFVQAAEADVWRLCARLVDRSSADDLTQDTFVRAMRALPGFEGRSSARTWLLAIARNTCADEIRRRTRRRRLHLRAQQARSADVPDPAAESALLDLIGGLRPERREAFVLTQMTGLSYAEAAEVCGCPVGTIRSRVARARDDLVDLVDPAHAPDEVADAGADELTPGRRTGRG